MKNIIGYLLFPGAPNISALENKQSCLVRIDQHGDRMLSSAVLNHAIALSESCEELLRWRGVTGS